LIAEYPLKPNVQICLQPISLSDRATQLCIETVQARGWRLSVQTHEYIGET
jgi:7-carboxy-7-deazaguanine synthase